MSGIKGLTFTYKPDLDKRLTNCSEQIKASRRENPTTGGFLFVISVFMAAAHKIQNNSYYTGVTDVTSRAIIFLKAGTENRVKETMAVSIISGII